jgi:hypothetical protein
LPSHPILAAGAHRPIPAAALRRIPVVARLTAAAHHMAVAAVARLILAADRLLAAAAVVVALAAIMVRLAAVLGLADTAAPAAGATRDRATPRRPIRMK